MPEEHRCGNVAAASVQRLTPQEQPHAKIGSMTGLGGRQDCLDNSEKTEFGSECCLSARGVRRKPPLPLATPSGD
jgi:hypothetical protein